MARKSLNISLEYDKKKATQDLENLLKDLQKNTPIKINIDTNLIDSSLKGLTDTLNNITKQMQNAFNTSQYIKNQASQVDNITTLYEKQSEAINKLGNEKNKSSTYKINSDGTQELIKDVTTLNTGLGKTETITDNVKSGLTTMTEKVDFSKIENTISSMQSKLNQSSKNGFIDESVLTNLQNKLNSINTNTPEKEIKELQDVLNNLGSSDSQIVRVQSEISKMESNLEGMKGKYGGLVGDSSSISQLQKYENELNNLKNILTQLKSGENFSGSKLTSELNSATSSSRELKLAVTNSANALRLAQRDAVSFGDAIKQAFQNAGLYMSTYEAINMVFSAFKDGIKTVIDMNTEMANLNKVVNMTKEQLNSMSDSAVQMGKDLGQSSTEVAKAQAEFGRMYKDSDTINSLSKTAIMGANVMDDTSTKEVAKGLTTIISAMKLEANDSMTILDSMNEIKCVSPYIVMCK